MINNFMAIFPFVLYVFIKLCSWFVQQLLMLETTLLFEGMGLHDHHKELRLDVDNMSYEVWHDVETNGNLPFILGSYVFFDVFRGHGTDLWALNIERPFILEVWPMNIKHWTCTFEEKWINCGNCEKRGDKNKSSYGFSLKRKVQCKHGKKVWESKDEKLWVHDLFDELTTRDESFLWERQGLH